MTETQVILTKAKKIIYCKTMGEAQRISHGQLTTGVKAKTSSSNLKEWNPKPHHWLYSFSLNLPLSSFLLLPHWLSSFPLFRDALSNMVAINQMWPLSTWNMRSLNWEVVKNKIHTRFQSIYKYLMNNFNLDYILKQYFEYNGLNKTNY